jgi:hypothetical protein
MDEEKYFSDECAIFYYFLATHLRIENHMLGIACYIGSLPVLSRIASRLHEA